MLSPEKSDTYRRAFGGRAPHCQPDLCLNAGYKRAGCTFCVDTCPVDAIHLEKHHPQLDESSCVHCGACLPACPTDAFTQVPAPEATLLQTANQSETDSLVVVCPVHQEPALTHTPAELVIRHRRCLAALSVTDLLALSRDSFCDIWLDDTPCARCRIGGTHAQILSRAGEANSLLVAFGHDPVVFPLMEHIEQASADPRALPLVDVMQHKMSRRGLFGAFRTTVVDRPPPAQMADQSPDPPVPSASVYLPHNIPASRIALLRCLERLALSTDRDSVSADGPFVAVEMEQNLCSGCGLCARICPAGALSFDADEEHYSLTFLAAACIDCSICSIACPEEAVSLIRHSNAATWLDPESIELAAGDLTLCEKCGVATATHRIEDKAVLCYVCRPSPGLVRALHSDHGAAFDLGWKEREPNLAEIKLVPGSSQ